MNELMRWLAEHGKDTLETTGLILSLGYTAASFRADARERRISNLIATASAHRELWKELINKPELARVLKTDVDLVKHPVTVVEERFVHLIITHLAVSFEAIQNDELTIPGGLEHDVATFFALPIPAQVWKWSRQFQKKNFVSFVETALGL